MTTNADTTVHTALSVLARCLSRNIPTNAPPPQFGMYAFARAGRTAVARNITLDGNSFQDSPHVAKRPFFAIVELGTALWTRWFEAGFSYVYWGKEFYDQQADSKLRAVSLSFY